MTIDRRRSQFGRILRSSFIMGGASIISLGCGIARMKVAALILGPTGVGIIGLLQSLMQTATTVASLGLENVGARQIAEAGKAGDERQMRDAKVALYVATMVLALAGTSVFWVFKEEIAANVGVSGITDNALSLIAIGIGFSVLSAANMAYLNGLQRIGDMARVTIAAGLVGSLGAIAGLSWGRDIGMSAFVVAVPIATAVASTFYVARLRHWNWTGLNLLALPSYWKTMVRLGTAVVTTALVGSFIHLAIRSFIQHEAGANALGLFQSAWVVSIAYISFILAAMTKDYYPRLVSCMGDDVAANDLMNNQSEVAVLLAAPVLIVLVGFAPSIVWILYSAEFLPSADILRWQAFGDALRILSFPVALGILARGKGGIYFFVETGALLVWCGVIWVALPLLGLRAMGAAYVLMFVVYLPVVYLYARAHANFAWRRGVLVASGCCMVYMGVVVLASSLSEIGAMMTAVVGALAFGLTAAIRLGLLAGASAAWRQRWFRN